MRFKAVHGVRRARRAESRMLAGVAWCVSRRQHCVSLLTGCCQRGRRATRLRRARGCHAAQPRAALRRSARRSGHASPRRSVTRQRWVRAMAHVDGAIDVSHACRLAHAARKQALGGHYARAVELYERAIAAAEALRQPDCLIVASLRCRYLEAQHNMSFAAPSGDDSDDAQRGARVQTVTLFQAHLPAVLETLERRRAAGTLLQGCCRAHEVAWEAECVRTNPRPSGEPERDEERIESFRWLRRFLASPPISQPHASPRSRCGSV